MSDGPGLYGVLPVCPRCQRMIHRSDLGVGYCRTTGDASCVRSERARLDGERAGRAPAEALAWRRRVEPLLEAARADRDEIMVLLHNGSCIHEGAICDDDDCGMRQGTADGVAARIDALLAATAPRKGD